MIGYRILVWAGVAAVVSAGLDMSDEEPRFVSPFLDSATTAAPTFTALSTTFSPGLELGNVRSKTSVAAPGAVFNWCVVPLLPSGKRSGSLRRIGSVPSYVIAVSRIVCPVFPCANFHPP